MELEKKHTQMVKKHNSNKSDNVWHCNHNPSVGRSFSITHVLTTKTGCIYIRAQDKVFMDIGQLM